MIKLKNLLKESVLVTEGTRWLVGIEQPNGKIMMGIHNTQVNC